MTDRAALEAHRARARKSGDGLFLHLSVRDEIQERLAEVNRSFTNAAIVSPYPEIWRPRMGDARLIHDTETLDFGAVSHDLVIHALALHWADDPLGQLIQCRRALGPDGLFVAALFGGRTLAELRACLAEAETRLRGGLSPRIAPLAEIRELGALLQRAGFALPVADTSTITASYSDIHALLHEVRAMGESNALMARDRTMAPRGLFDLAGSLYEENFSRSGRIEATFDVIFLTGWAPGPDQQKPLRPGSAAARLADALGTTERGTEGPSD